MIIAPKVKDFICTTAHPDGCEENVKRQIEYIKNNKKINGAKKVLVIGCSTGYGLASRITATYAMDSSTIGVMLERPSNGKRTAAAGFYNTKAFEKFASNDGYYAKTINGDAFSKEIKEQTINTIKNDLGKVDMVIYSLAAPRRTIDNGITYNSVLKTVNNSFTSKSLNLSNNEIVEVTIPPATDEEINATIKVMGGEDWKNWIDLLYKNEVLGNNFITVAYSYIGPKLTYPIYSEGTIGKAKNHLYETSLELNKKFEGIGKAYISVNKAITTQASSAIPIVPLYMSILYKVMKQKGVHEGCIEQISRLFYKLNENEVLVDEKGRIRLDDYEMREDIQQEVKNLFEIANTKNIKDIADLDGYWNDFYNMFGFRFDNIDYNKEVENF